MNSKSDQKLHLHHYMFTLIKTLIAFCIATFCVAMYFSHLGQHWLLPGIFLIVLYVFVLGLCIRNLTKHLNVAALMLITPIVPLAAMIVILLLVPVLQKLA